MIERSILIGLITSTDFCKGIADVWNGRLLESQTAKRMALWCWEHYEKYGEAPGRGIERLFYKKTKDPQFPKDIAEEIEQEILPELSEEYEREGVNIEALLRDAREYLADRYLTQHLETIAGLQANGEMEEAERLAASFKPLSVAVSNLDAHVLSLKQIKERKRPSPPMLLSPWLREGQTTIVYGNFGSGKSLLTILIGYILGVQDSDSKECEIDTWQVKQPTGTLYIDGELGEKEMEERIDQFAWLGPQINKYKMRVLSIPEYQIATEDSFYLSERVNQLKVIKWLKEHPTYKLLVLDSASTLFGLEEENDNSEWNKKINPLLRDLRALGVACLLLHHSGKDGKRGLRGASAMGAMAHNIFKLTPHPDKDVDEGEAWFNITKDKQRAGGFSFKKFGMHFFQEEDDTETHWEITQTT